LFISPCEGGEVQTEIDLGMRERKPSTVSQVFHPKYGAKHQTGLIKQGDLRKTVPGLGRRSLESPVAEDQ
jgi:hypothetical protein